MRQPKRPITQNIGRRLAEVRKHRGLTQQELADAVGVAKAVIQHYEHDRAELSVSRLLRLAEALGVSADVLLAEPRSPMPRAPKKCRPRY